jgi:hypothetical protein
MSRNAFDNNMRGVLFKNDKEGLETRPDYRGQCEINRVEYYIDTWINTDRNGRKFLSLRFKPKLAADVAGGVRNPPPIKTPDKDDEPFNDQIPF